MSATNRGAVRLEQDDYPTPAWCVRRALEAINLPNGTWLEPCAGAGAIITAAAQFLPESNKSIMWTALDIRQQKWRKLGGARLSAASQAKTDFLLWNPNGMRYSVAFSNPPYSRAEEIIRHALTMADHVVMLLRVNFLAGGKRSTWMRETRPSIYVLPNRPSFTGHGTDATEYAWFHWSPGREGIVRVLADTLIEERKAA